MILLKLLLVLLIPLIVFPAFAQQYNEVLPTDKGTLNVGISTIPENLIAGGVTKFKIDFINPKTEKIQEHIDYRFTLQKEGKNIFGPIPLTHTGTGTVTIPVEITEAGTYFGLIEIEGILFQPIPVEAVSFSVTISDTLPSGNGIQGDGGGCLIATATFGSEMSPQVQQLRELRDNIVLKTESGKIFMKGFNEFYYSFSPAVSDYERQNDFFRDGVKIVITPLLTSLSVLNYIDIDSESEMVGYGISLILLNVGIYFVIPTVVITKWYKIRRK
jgi:hypothetical protein